MLLSPFVEQEPINHNMESCRFNGAVDQNQLYAYNNYQDNNVSSTFEFEIPYLSKSSINYSQF